ncbi:MAG: hypothetical protein ACMUEL_06460 [Flavobacteriales bacterium Tduv]
MEHSTRRSEFFKRLYTLIQWEGMDKEIRKIYQKIQGIKGKPSYSEISLFTIILLSDCYDLSDVGMEELIKKFTDCMLFCNLSIGRSDSILYNSMQISQ